MAADGGQDGGADGRADQRERELVEAVGLAKIDEAAFGQAGREIGVEELADVIAAGADRRRQDKDQQFLDARGHSRRQKAQADAGAAGGDDAKGKLENAAGQHRPGHRHRSCVAAFGYEQERADQGEIEQRGREGRRGESGKRIQDSAEQRNQADEDQIGKGDPGQEDGEGELFRIACPAFAGDRDDHGRHGDDEQGSDENQGRQEDRLHFLGEAPGVLEIAVLPDPAREQRHEALAERSLAKQPAEQVGKLERPDEHLCRRRGAHDSREDHFADEAEDSADEGQSADRSAGLDEVHARLALRRGRPAVRRRRPAGRHLLWACCCASSCAM